MADSTVDSSTTNTSFDELPKLDTTLPDVSTGDYFSANNTPGPSTYNANTQSDAYALDNAYRQYIGRPINQDELTWRGARFNTTPLSQQLQDIQNSQEGQTIGRAKAEINPLVDAEIAGYGRQADIEKLKAAQGLSALDPKYQDLFGSLQFGLGEQENAVNQQLSSMAQDYDVNYGRLNQSLGQVPLKAFNMANRRGLLDSSIAYDTLGQLAQPIQNNLADLTRAYGNNRSAAQSKLQNIIEKYQFDRQGLVSNWSQEAQPMKDAFALALEQSRSQANQAETTRGAKIFARSGELGDAFRNYQLNQGQLSETQRANTLTNQAAMANLAEQARQFNKLHP